MNKIVAFLLIVLISFSYEDRMRCFDDLDGSPTEKCYVRDRFNNLRYYDSCKSGKICTEAEPVDITSRGNFNFGGIDYANYGVCAPVPFGGFEGAVCGDNAECLSNNCDGTSCGEPKDFCKTHSECKKENYCNKTEIPYHTASGIEYIEPTYQCKELAKPGGECYYDHQCPPLYLCLKNNDQDHIAYGKCQKIGSVDGYIGSSDPMLCKSGYQYEGYCVTDASMNCVTGVVKVITSKGTYTDDATNPSNLLYADCRPSLLDGSDIPIIDKKAIDAFKEYAKEVDKIEVKQNKKHANYGTIRYHYDKKKLKEKLIKAKYYELNNENDDTAECLFDSVKQIVLLGEKINFSKILVLTFALLLI